MKKYFDFSHFKGDLFGGITAGIVALPLALAFGVSSGLGPSAGLYGAIFVSFFAALFGGTNTQISGPTAPLTAVSIVIIGTIIASFDGEVAKALPVILAIFLLAGLLQVGMGFLGFGKYIKYIPTPVVSGFMTAIGLIILITQILPSLGYYPSEDNAFVNQFNPLAKEIILDNILKEETGEGLLVLENFKETIIRGADISEAQIYKESKVLAKKEASGVLGAIKMFGRAFTNIAWLEFILALGTIIIIFGFKKITTKIPSTLVALFVMSAISIGFNLDYRPIEEIPSGFPIPHFEIFTDFSFGNITPYIFTAITLALLGSIDSLLTSVVADNMTKTEHKPNKELIGQGIGNSIAALFGGIPGAGATIRTVVNIQAGGKTRLSGMFAALLLLFILLVIGPLASKIPAAVLAGILITVGIGVIDYKGLKALKFMPKSEVVIMFVVLFLSTFWNLVYAVGIGLVFSSLIFMKKIGDLTSEKSDISALEDEFESIEDNTIFIKEIHGPVFFGSNNEIVSMAKQIPESAHTVIVRLGPVPYIDQTGLFAMEDIFLDFVKRDIHIILVALQKQPKYMLEKIDIIPGLIPNTQIFDSYEEALSSIRKN